MTQQIDNRTRIILKFYLPALATAICLQRKMWYGWRTTSWIYPSIMKGYDCKRIREWLEWDEGRKEKSQKEIGIEIMSRCDGKF